VIKQILTNWGIETSHPPEEELLSCVDGELSVRRTFRARRHLESCWPCRTNLDRMTETIGLVVEYHDQILDPAIPVPPPGNWNGFADRLRRVEAAYGQQPKSYWDTVAQIWNSFFTFISPSNWTPAMIRGFSGSVTALVIAAVVWQLVGVSTVTASELLNKSLRSEQTAIESVSQAVVYKKVRIQRQGDQAFDWDIWRDTTRGRVRIGTGSDQVLTVSELSSILGRNGMIGSEILSPDSFRAWHDSLADKTDRVERNISSDGERTIALTTINNTADRAGDIGVAILNVRTSDWHPITEELQVISDAGRDIYTITELEFRVIELSLLRSDFFDNEHTPRTAQIANSAPSPLTVQSPTESNLSVLPQPAAGSPADMTAASLETEVEIFKQLDAINALSDARITVTRTPGGQLRVGGVVDSVQRKQEILNALVSVHTGHGVIIDIQTIEEVANKKKALSATSNVSMEDVKVDTDASLPVETELRAALAKRGVAADSMDKEIRGFAGSVTASSRELRRNALALKQIAERFTPTEVERLDPAKRNEWKALIHSRARAIAGDVRNLTLRLSVVFPGLESGASGGADLSAGVDAAAQRLFGLAAACDTQVNQSFAISAGGHGSASVKSVQFWRSLAQMSAIANELQKY
jgi:hypothetical protein